MQGSSYLDCPFIVMKNRPKGETNKEREKAKGVSWQSSGLVIRVTLGVIPPSAGCGSQTHWAPSAIVTLKAILSFTHAQWKALFKILNQSNQNLSWVLWVEFFWASALRGLSSGLIFKKASWYHVLATANNDALHINSFSSLRGELRAGQYVRFAWFNTNQMKLHANPCYLVFGPFDHTSFLADLRPVEQTLSDSRSHLFPCLLSLPCVTFLVHALHFTPLNSTPALVLSPAL